MNPEKVICPLSIFQIIKFKKDLASVNILFSVKKITLNIIENIIRKE